MSKNLIIFGAGDTATQVIKIIGTSNIAYIADNFPKQESLFDIPIIDFEKMKEFYLGNDEAVVIVAALDYCEEICLKLEVNEIKRYYVWQREGYAKFAGNEKIKNYKSTHKGERCFIIGNGPSLRMSDLDILHKYNEICFGTNKIFYAFEETDWRPDYYLAADAFILLQHAEEIAKMSVKAKFIADRTSSFWTSGYSTNCLKFHIINQKFYPNMPDFSPDFSKFSIEGNTITYSAIQLAVYMGFSELFLLGVDFDYSGDMRKGENHFSKNYISAESKFASPDPSQTLLSYKKAELVSVEHYFKIYNATRGGKLEVFKRVNFDEILKSASSD